MKNLNQITSIAILASLWCIVEIYGDLLLRTLQIPLRGALLMSFGVIILSIARFTIRGRWVILMLGILTGLLKLLVLGVLSIWPSLGIFIETLLVQLIFLIGKPRMAQVITAGIVGVIWSFFHPFLTHGILAGMGIYRIYLNLAQKSMHVFQLGTFSLFEFFVLWFFLHLLFGIAAGIAAWQMVKLIRHRVGFFPDAANPSSNQ